MKKRTTGPLTVKSALLICGLGLFVGVAFQLFGWLYIPGVGLVIAITVALIALTIAAFAFEKLSSTTASLLVATAFVSGWIAIRSAEFLVVIDILAVLTLLLLALWSLAYDTPFWRMRALDAAFAVSETSINSLGGAGAPVGKLLERRGESRLGGAAPYVRGALFALPLVILFGALLSSADAVFSDLISDLFPSVDIGDTFADVLWALFFSWIAIGLTVLAVQPIRRDSSARENGTWALRRRERPDKDRYIEATVVLGAMVILFLMFVVVQFAYLFGGETQIDVPGVTYAEYAREGFFQLVAVTALTVAVIAIAMRGVGSIADPRRSTAFKALCWLLVSLTFVILASALKRIGLYEEAYGLTRARYVSQVLALWLGAMLVLVAVQVQRRQKGIVLGGSVAFAVLAVIALNAVNPDARIAARNLDRDRIDLAYITELSPDAMPTVFDRVDPTTLSADDRRLLQQWVCGEFESERDWRELSLGYSRAESSADAVLPPTDEACHEAWRDT